MDIDSLKVGDFVTFARYTSLSPQHSQVKTNSGILLGMSYDIFPSNYLRIYLLDISGKIYSFLSSVKTDDLYRV